MWYARIYIACSLMRLIGGSDEREYKFHASSACMNQTAHSYHCVKIMSKWEVWSESVSGGRMGKDVPGKNKSTYVSAKTILVLVAFSMVNLVLPPWPAIRPIARDKCSPPRALTKLRK